MRLQIINIKILIMLTLATLAALATFPYGYRFISHYGLANDYLTLATSISFALIATLANAILGTYSLVKIDIEKWDKTTIVIIFISLLGSIPMGCVSFFGYIGILPGFINALMSCIVVFVNAAIAFTAMRAIAAKRKSLLIFFFSTNEQRSSQWLLCVIGVFIGILVSLVGYVATFNGLNALIAALHINYLTSYYLTATLAAIAWLPSAALYAHANHSVARELHSSLLNFSQQLKQLKLSQFVLPIIFLISGTALAEITRETFEHALKSYHFAVDTPLQQFSYYLLMPLALISSAAVNYFSTTKLLQIYVNNKKAES
ncbi:MAG: hypothetical protein H0W64_09735 [Gammaproteobacteria bacterium]|nr:hypothetical protein [Gammaproteobacteria bacterium]